MFEALAFLGASIIKPSLLPNLPHPHASGEPRLMAQREILCKANFFRIPGKNQSSHSIILATHRLISSVCTT
jgi:hypothetical protein